MEQPASGASLRPALLAWAQAQYGTRPEFLWRTSPGFAVLRRADDQKWYALLMDLPRARLGLPGPGMVDAVNLKCDPILAGSLRRQPGILPAYHMNKESWVTVLLDGTVPPDTVRALLAESYRLAGPHAQARGRGPQAWIFPANPARYDLAAAFAGDPEILWRQRNHIAVGDRVYLYLTAPIAAILYRCQVTAVDLPCPWAAGQDPGANAFRMKLQQTYAPGLLPIGLLQAHGVRSVRSARRAPAALVRAIEVRTARG